MIGAIFATFGFVTPMILFAAGIYATSSIEVLWPTQVAFWLVQPGDKVWAWVILCLAILSNAGLYGLAGLMIGGIWDWIRSERKSR